MNTSEKRIDPKKEILDYIFLRGRFQEGRELVGMSSSRRPQLFILFFDTLDDKDRDALIRTLVHTLVGDEVYLEEHIRDIVSLLVHLAISRHSACLLPYQSCMEELFGDEHNLCLWAESDDETPRNSSQYRRSWSFALSLFCILKRQRSTVADEGYVFLKKRLKSERFNQALEANLRLMEAAGSEAAGSGQNYKI